MVTEKRRPQVDALVHDTKISVTKVDTHTLDTRFPGAVHQGVVLEVDPLPHPIFEDLLATSGPLTFLALDQIQDPHNIGALIRSACALKADGLIMSHQGLPPLDGVLGKAAAGALEKLPIALVGNLSQALLQAKEADFWAFGLGEQGQPFTQLPHVTRKILVLGAEGKGLRPLVQKRTDGLFALPTNPDFPTLNVSVAGALALLLSQNMTP